MSNPNEIIANIQKIPQGYFVHSGHSYLNKSGEWLKWDVSFYDTKEVFFESFEEAKNTLLLNHIIKETKSEASHE